MDRIDSFAKANRDSFVFSGEQPKNILDMKTAFVIFAVCLN